ncbi:MAG: TonB family protein [Ekhidna sp.]|uniref:energy transducer TonB n=1 Tax=Ekhidna sp. TaxID=2608089 RepID=UPI0032EE1158
MSTDKNHSEQFERYLKGQMSPEEAHAFEREVLDDPFAQEALEGYEAQGAETINDLEKLRSQAFSKKKTFPFIRIAAAVALLIVGSFTVYFFIDQVGNEQLAMEKESPEEMTQQPAPDTTKSVPKITTEEESIKPAEEVVDKPKLVAEVPPRKEETPKSEIATEEEPAEETDNRGAGMMADNAIQDDDDFMLAEADEVIAEELVSSEMELDVEEELEKMTIEPLMAKERAKKIASDAQADQPSALSSRSAARGAASYLPRTISGIVTDDTGESLPGVNVTIKGTTTGTTTDLDGNYRLAIEDNSSLVFSFVGFESQEVQVGARSTIDVTMGGATELQEVVVTGYSGSGQPDPGYSPAKPLVGNSDYKNYMETNLQYPEQAITNQIEGTVVLLLAINASGEIEDIEIKKSLGYGCDEEAIRLVKEGPGWEPAEKDGVKVEDKVKVRVKFKLE